MNKKNYDYALKILTIGDSSVGKTSLILRFTEDTFKNSLKGTIGIDFKSKIISINSKIIKLLIFDTAGQERYRSITRNYYKDTDGILMVFDVKNKNTFNNLTFWISEINKNCEKKDVSIVVVGNKIDGDDREVNEKEAENIIKKYGYKYIETSALADENIQECFEMLIYDILDKKKINILSGNTNLSTGIILKNNNIINNIDTNSENNNNYGNNMQNNYCCYSPL